MPVSSVFSFGLVVGIDREMSVYVSFVFFFEMEAIERVPRLRWVT